MTILNVLWEYYSAWISWSTYIKNQVKIHWRILSYIVLFPLFLFVSIVLTIINTLSGCFLDLRVGHINLATSGIADTFISAGLSEFPMPFSCSLSDSLSASKLTSLSFGFPKSPFQSYQLLVSAIQSGTISLSYLAGRWSILLMLGTFNTWDRPPVRSYADIPGGKGDLNDNWNTAAPSRWKSDQDLLTISAISEIFLQLWSAFVQCEIRWM